MMKPRGAEHAENGSAQIADAAGQVFQHLGEASERLMELQAQATAVVLMESAARYAEVTEGMLRSLQPRQWMELQHAQMRSAMEPMQAWMEAATGLQAVLMAAFLQTFAMMLFPRAAGRRKRARGDRRIGSVIIPFPDRRGKTAA